MNVIKKFAVLILLIFGGVVVASLYGAVHNQLSFTVSSEYFTAFKFRQFSIPPSWPQRSGAAFVGVLASWWMGLPIGFILGLVGLIHKNASSMLKFSLQSFTVVTIVTLAIGIVGLLYGFVYLSQLPLSEFSDWYIPPALNDSRAFIEAGSMHNFSYLGGVIGMFVGVWWQVRCKKLAEAKEVAAKPL
jgi:hypothetical protein